MNKAKFKCWKTNLYGTCKRCLNLHDNLCDYGIIMNFKPLNKRNRCPICIHKENFEKCNECKEIKNNKLYKLEVE